MSKDKPDDKAPAAEAAPAPKRLTASEAVTLGKRLDGEMMQRRIEYGRYATAYYGTSASVPSQATLSQRLKALAALSDQNLLRAVGEAAAAKVASDPEIRVLTSGASWQKQLNARRQTRYISGLNHASGMRAIAHQVIQDCMLAPTGASRSWIDNGKLRKERIPPHCLVWSQTAGRNPRQLWLRHGVPRREAEIRFRRNLKDAPRYVPDPIVPSFIGADTLIADRIEVWEYWEKAQGEHPGQYIVATGDIELQPIEEYPWEFFTITPLKWSESFDDFGGTPLAASVWPYHQALQRLNNVMERGVNLACVPRIMAPKGAEVKQFSNALMDRMEYLPGLEPKITTANAFPKEFYDLRGAIKAEAFEFAGVSQAFATGQKVAGVTSGRGIREQAEESDRRLGEPFQRIQEFYEQNAKVDLALMQQAYGKSAKGGVKGAKAKAARVMAPGTRALQEIDFDSFELAEDETLLRCSSVNALARTPSAKFDQITEAKELLGDLFRPEWALAALNMGDAEKWEDTLTAGTNLATWQVDQALEHGKYEAPETGPLEYLQTLVEIGTRELMAARQYEDLDPRHLDQLRKLIAVANHYLQTAAPKPAAPAPGAGGPAPVDPGMPPVA